MLRRVKIIVGVFLFMLLFLGGKRTVEAATKIHYLGLRGSTDAILLESEGRFGMIDSGEDWDYPDGSNSKYPLRSGIDRSNGHEQQVIYYMKKVGVTNDNFDFYLGTHAHSDHIGTGDEVLSQFTPKVVYLKKYSNANISNRNAFWDNRYVYDGLVGAAKKSKLVQNFKEGTTIKLGKNMKITLYNAKVKYWVADDNWNSIVAKVRTHGITTILAADATAGVMNKLNNEGKFGKIDILKLPHHGYPSENPSGLMSVLAPKQAIVTGPMSNLSAETSKALIGTGTHVISNNTGIAALVTKYSATGYSTSAQNIKSGWFTYNKSMYYIAKNGQPARGWKKISGKWYFFNGQGKVRTGWQTINGQVFYFKESGKKGIRGEMAVGWQKPNGTDYVYFKKNGATRGSLLKGWQKINKKWYYFKKAGSNGAKTKKLSGWQKIDGKQYYFRTGKNKLDGYAYTNRTVKIDGKRYTFDKEGVLTKGKVPKEKPTP